MTTPGASAQADTIFALSSGAPPAAIAVVRVSGPSAGAAVRALAGGLPAPRRAGLRTLRDAAGMVLDRALLLWFPGPRTATGEDLAEFHLHGGRAVTQATLAALSRLPGLRPAIAGEFTRRALENGVVDLAEAEGLADLLAAETETQRRAALAMAGGALSRRVEELRLKLLELSAMVEAAIEFADEGDIAVDEVAIARQVGELQTELSALAACPSAERLRDGVRVVIAGPPNAGKSTLLNALAGREAAITSPEAGTTRDLIEVPVAIGGIAFLLTDTAGLRMARDPIEQLGVARAEAALAAADIVLWLGGLEQRPRGALWVHARADIAGAPAHRPDVILSARTGEGMDDLQRRLVEEAGTLVPREAELALSARQRDIFSTAADALAGKEDDLVLLAERLALVRCAFDRLLGRVGTEDMLDALFGRFCVGK